MTFEQELVDRVRLLLAQRLVEYAVLSIQATGIAPTRALVANQLVAMNRVRPPLVDPQEERLAKEAVAEAGWRLAAGEWDELIDQIARGEVSFVSTESE